MIHKPLRTDSINRHNNATQKRNVMCSPWFLYAAIQTAVACSFSGHGFCETPVREIKSLNNDWFTVLHEPNQPDEMYRSKAAGSNWKKVTLPHNWDDYGGARQRRHGNLHGTAWYKKQIEIPGRTEKKRYFLRFEGVGTYATVILNGINLGRHPGGRVSFTLDVTSAVKPGQTNLLLVKAEHPVMISDMPCVCGGCSSEWGFSEGSQPFGIYRPVVMEVTDSIRIEPFGVHVWNDEKAETVCIETEVKNYGDTAETIEIISTFKDKRNQTVFRLAKEITLEAGQVKIVKQSATLDNPHFWSVDDPYLYAVSNSIIHNNKRIDKVLTPFGIRTVSWPVIRKDGDHRFLLNGKAVFINGTCEYEHLLGQSHAFSSEQIQSRVKQIKAAGFNAFREAHQPHHLLYQKLWDETGTLFWSQFSAHIWYDTQSFRNHFISQLRQWIKERRNSPSVVMWGLQNESVLPKAFAEECCKIIRQMDPTASRQRIITTCNGGKGTDWNVVQNWSGTYAGDLYKYDEELSRPDQLLNGEYGAWRSIDLHTEGSFDPEGVWSEDRMTQLLEMKVRQAESVKDRVCGQFQWLFNSHDNPGRRQPDEGYRIIDKIGPFNHKGLVTIWEEPLDVYYMYRANYVPARDDPMVYIVSHTWPDRFSAARKATLRVYSNCEEVELFNDAAETQSLGRRKRSGVGTHFVWEQAEVRYNVLYARGYYQGKSVAEDLIILNNLPQAPHFDRVYQNIEPLLRAEPGYHYLYRVNCGGDTYIDRHGQKWHQDTALGNSNGHWGSRSWADDDPDLNPYLASQRRTYDPIRRTRDWELFQTFRFGRHKLSYHFPVPNGRYRVELYFIEPWHGTGGSIDCQGLRIFDVAVNDITWINDLDIWAEVGTDTAYKKVVQVNITDGRLDITFPEVKAGQAVISAIAVASLDKTIKPAPASPAKGWSWETIPKVMKTPTSELPEGMGPRPVTTYPAQEARSGGNFTKVTLAKREAVCFEEGNVNRIEWDISVGLAQVYALRFKYMNTGNQPIVVNLQIVDDKGDILKDDRITFPETGEKWRLVNTTTEHCINAGKYVVRLFSAETKGLCFHVLDVQ